MKEYIDYEIIVDLSRSTEEEANVFLTILARNGYTVYFSSDTFDSSGPKKQEVCFGTDQEFVSVLKKT